MNSLTLENVFYCHEVATNMTIGESAIQRKSHCWEVKLNKNNQSVLRKVVTNLTGLEMLKTRHYIRPGETCAICLDGIYMKRNAFLNSCGHGFHYSCLSESQLYNNTCPMCRDEIYLSTAQKRIHALSRADQMEMMPLLSFPQLCHRRRKPFHYLGTCEKCIYCRNMRKSI